MKVGYLAPVNPEVDRMAWSGTYYNTYHAIKSAGVDVKWIPYGSQGILFKGLTKFTSLVYKISYGKGSSTHSRMMSKIHELFINQKLINSVDLLFVPGQIEMVVGLKTNKPIIYYTDGTFSKMINYYWFGFSSKAIKEGNLMEKLAVEKAKYNFRASDWAAKSTIDDYKANTQNTYVFPFGADVPDKINKARLPDYEHNGLKLLFSGKEWDRKGGDIAVAAANYLNSIGIRCKLYIVGMKSLPDKLKDKDFIKFIGYIDKNDPSEYKRYLDLYHECNAFILPTRAECAGLVFAEANAFGMPIFATETGGVTSYVLNDKNGYTLPLSAKGVDFGKCIERVYKNKEFKRLSNGSRDVYLNLTSWKA
ncbi:glycosyltransferase family 4 protein [Lactobacillus crispatus]|uniref:glycosyltransferase family 4 protein n=1 Tax=Lactobacillus crispatus TaxID=47770 RepID=UPI001CB7E97E|nr:glycosyltransferase family 4 protein [Lactobacillus crispatus]